MSRAPRLIEQQPEAPKDGVEMEVLVLGMPRTGTNLLGSKELSNLTVAGTLTSSSWANGIQSRLRKEIRTNLPSSTRAITAAEVDSLPYLNAFCNEVFRLYPPVPSIVRETRIDTCLDGTFIPKGTTLLILAGATNLDKERWGPDAEDFNPDRWMGEGRANSGGSDSSYANLSFLTGPRGYIEQSFAKSELLCLVAVLVGRFNIELQDPNKKLEIVRAISASPSDGVIARFTWLEV
ncbi:cytochrome P450 [Pseudomassariella vexata]|uniref:Cytochrome P450 n=1 Tax=Pseudomassariella vexata TaxID=1141098 RepID=A0A1Y2EBE8_9PEZI|nr:cytochrome P450 [Pseudomassariella vexata]ORY68881.1 cytochrome P450 [Pseudomassariella vexata]